MAIIRIKNKRTEGVFEITSRLIEDAIEDYVLKSLEKNVKYPIELSSSLIINNAKEHMNYINSFRYGNIRLKDRKKAQSYNSVIFNHVIHSDKKLTIVPFLYNELQRDVPFIVNLEKVSVFINFILDYIKNKESKNELDIEYIGIYKKITEESKSGDEFYLYLDSYQISYDDSEIPLSFYMKDEGFFERLKNDMINHQNMTRADYFQSIIDEGIEGDPEIELTDKEEESIIDSKCSVLDDSKLENFYFENNYNVIAILDDMIHKY